MDKLIISACICGAEVTKEQNPNVPYQRRNTLHCRGSSQRSKISL